MPRFYFHLHDGEEVHDDEGQDLPDVTAARAVALRSARSLICEQIATSGRVSLSRRIEVEDANWRPVFTLPFRNAITFED